MATAGVQNAKISRGHYAKSSQLYGSVFRHLYRHVWIIFKFEKKTRRDTAERNYGRCVYNTASAISHIVVTIITESPPPPPNTIEIA